MGGEAEPSIERDGCDVVAIDVQHAGGDADTREVIEPRDGEHLAETEPVEVGMDGDHVDLAEHR